MRLYDKLIAQVLQLIASSGGDQLMCGQCRGEACRDSGEFDLILKSDMAYELGGGSLPAVSGLFFTSDQSFVPEDEIWRLGADLSEITEDVPYARLTLIRVAEGCFSGEAEAYSDLRKMEYTRYHVNPEGYMMRISTASEREPVRISRKALNQGLSLEKAGRSFIKGYHSHPKVEAVKLIFVTAADFPYEQLAKLAHQGEQITKSMNHIFNNLVMDCSACNLKPVCDEVEGLRELHQAALTK
ncbi:Uncharacterised protein [uncultured Eubacterium sp.]|nr:Uncharacterised protein [uncultured Eubacterium sp.]